MTPKEQKDAPLGVEIVNGVLRISIGVNTLAHAVTYSDGATVLNHGDLCSACEKAPREELRTLVEKLEGNWRVRAASLRKSAEPGAYQGIHWTTPKIMRERAAILEELANELAALSAASSQKGIADGK